MRFRALTCAAVLAALPASAQEAALKIDLLLGHPIYHEAEQEAGVAMALSVTPGQRQTTDLMDLCEELRVAAGLGKESGKLRLATIFVVPYKGMAVEGFYLPGDGTFGSSTLVRGEDPARSMLDRIVGQAGIPPDVLDETNVEHEISCTPGEPLWSVAWYDVQDIRDEEPEAVIERAGQRFLAIHRSVVQHNAAARQLPEAQRATDGG